LGALTPCSAPSNPLVFSRIVRAAPLGEGARLCGGGAGAGPRGMGRAAAMRDRVPAGAADLGRARLPRPRRAAGHARLGCQPAGGPELSHGSALARDLSGARNSRGRAGGAAVRTRFAGASVMRSMTIAKLPAARLSVCPHQLCPAPNGGRPSTDSTGDADDNEMSETDRSPPDNSPWRLGNFKAPS